MRYLQCTLVWAVPLFLIAPLRVQAQPAGVTVKKDVVYGNVHGAGLLADIAYPEGKGPFPVILSVHGGRWVGSHRSDPGEGAIDVKQWAGFGLFAMSIDYRLVGCSPPPACYQDVQCAIRWLHAHKGKYPIDADRIFLFGMSAGGHLVSLAGTLGDGPYPRTGGWLKHPNSIRGVICLSGPYDLEKLSWGTLWKPATGDQLSARKLASPIQHVSAKTTPILILHSDNDGSVPIQQARDMAAALEKAKARHRLIVYQKKGHMRITDEVIKETRAFIDEIGKLPSPPPDSCNPPGVVELQGDVGTPPMRRRILIETDAGGDPDDEQSLVRFLLYTNEFDVEGIICTLAKARDKENLNPERTGLGIVRRQLKAYGECYPNLVKHDPRYPTLEYLWNRTIAGYDGDAGVKLILAAADADDPRPIWLCNWGTGHDSDESSFKLALDRVLKERGQAGYAKFKARFRLSSADRFGDHMRREPAFPIWVDTFRPELDGKRWYHRFAPLTAAAGGFDIKRDVLTGHGPLGALYPTNTGLSPQKEGDTMSFLYLVPTGMNDPMQPTWGSWGGRYGLNEKDAPRPHYWANQQDHWEGFTHRDHTLKRWAIPLQNDFRARLNWCVTQKEKANHPPKVVCQGDESGKILFVNAPVGKPFRLTATGTTDPDGDRLRYRWYVYPEAGTYPDRAIIFNSTFPEARLEIPPDAKGRSIHVILDVTDNGQPALTRYRRIVVTGAEGDS